MQDVGTLALEGEVRKAVVLEETVEDAGRENDGGRHEDVHVGEPPVDVVLVQKVVDEGDAARLASERAAADAVEARRVVEEATVEVDDLPAIPLVAVLGDGLDDGSPQRLERVVVADLARPQPLGEVELRPSLEPRREVVALAVEREALGGDVLELLLERAEVRGAIDLGSVGEPEDEVADAKALAHEAAQPAEEEARALEQERRADRLRMGLVLGPRGLQHDGDVAATLAHGAAEGQARQRIERAFPGKAHVGDDPEDLVGVAVEARPGLLVVVAEEDLGARADAHQLVREIQPLGHQAQRVVDELRVQEREERRVVADVVLDEDDGGHADHAGVVGDVELVLEVLDDRQQDADVALPQEEALERRDVLGVGELVERALVVGEEHDRVSMARARSARTNSSTFMSPSSIVVTMRLYLADCRALSRASAPENTRVMFGVWRRLSSRNSLRSCSLRRPSWERM